MVWKSEVLFVQCASWKHDPLDCTINPLKKNRVMHIAICQGLLPIVTKTSNNYIKPVKIKPALPAAIGSFIFWPCAPSLTTSLTKWNRHHNTYKWATNTKFVAAHPAITTGFNLVHCVIGCQVSLQFSPSSAVPGEDVTMQVTADPNSLCGVSAIDKSVLLQEPGKSLDVDKVITIM